MKLIRLYIKNHLLFNELDIRFNKSGRIDEKENYRLDFLVGVNGSGKSTLLRTLVEIFVSLQTGQGAEYEYYLEYELARKNHTEKVYIDKHWNNEHAIWHIVTTILTSEGETKEFYNPVVESQYLPERIVVYTTGSEEEWLNLLADSFRYTFSPDAPQEVLNDPIDRSIFELPRPGGNNKGANVLAQEESPFVLIRGSRLNAIALCGLLRYITEPENPYCKPLSKVLEAIEIKNVAGFSFRFRIYDRLSPKTTFEEILSIQPSEIHLASDRLLTFDLTGDNHQARSLLEKTGGAFGLYQRLDYLQEIGPTGESTIQPPSIFLQRNDQEVIDETISDRMIPSVFLFDWLSDGERAFLGRMALLAMLNMQDSLIILDEPEVHFNDYWKREIIQYLSAFIQGCSNQVLLTTHSTIVLSDVSANQVHLFMKDEAGNTRVIDNHSPLFGADPSFVMTNLLGTGRPGGTFSKNYLEEAIKRNDKEELRALMKVVGPGYWRLKIDELLGGED